MSFFPHFLQVVGNCSILFFTGIGAYAYFTNMVPKKAMFLGGLAGLAAGYVLVGFISLFTL